MRSPASALASLRRGHLGVRLAGRGARAVQSALTSATLGVTRPGPGIAAVVTLNADEENATVQAVLLGERSDLSEIVYVSPDPGIARSAVGEAARCLGLAVPTAVRYETLSYRSLLAAHRRASETYSTHVLIPGRDPSGRRVHTHLTHGSGLKPDTTFRGPATVLASITPEWVPQQLAEYRLPADTRVVPDQPRLRVMRRAVGDRSVHARLGLDPARELVVWAPTYRAIRRAGGEVRVSGVPFGEADGWDGIPDPETGDTLAQLRAAATARGAQFLAKLHPHDAARLEGLGFPALTGTSLREHGVTAYELFGAAEHLITDYSSIGVERQALGLPLTLWRPDLAEFGASYRGFRS